MLRNVKMKAKIGFYIYMTARSAPPPRYFAHLILARCRVHTLQLFQNMGIISLDKWLNHHF